MSTTTSSSLPKSGPPKNRLPMYLGVGLAAATGYYFYTAGGDPKVARKEIEHDAARASAAVRSELPGREKQAQKSAEEALSKVGSSVDATVRDGKNRIAEGQQTLEKTKDQASKTFLSKVDEADRKIESETAKAKSGISSWFGAGK